jgi:O-antigen biosynthesis protein
MNAKPSLSILMAVFNRLDLTRLCLPTLERTLAGMDYEVIIVDDCSTDGTREYLQTLAPPYRVVFNERKGNFAINNNCAASLARADTLCLLNNDTELTSGWLEPMLALLDKHPDAGLVGNIQRIPATGRLDHCGILFPASLVPLHYGQHRLFRPRSLAGPASRWGAVTAACAVIKKSLFESINGFDPSYVNGGEDIDLCLRLHARGYWHYVSHHSEILHHKGASPGRKTYNDANIVRLQAAHGDYLRRRLVPRDSRLAALSYLDSALSAPLRINGPKLFSALLTISRPHPSEALRKPDNIS